MILVDIYIPMIDRTADFHLEENVPVRSLVEEIGEMIAQITKSELEHSSSKLLLCDCLSMRILPENKTLTECGIKSGSRLLIV